MLTRRELLCAAVLLAVAPRAFAQDAASATSMVQTLGRELIAIVNAPGSAAQKGAKLAPLVESSVDIDDIGRFCLGRFWRIATPAQQQEYLRLFHGVLITSITRRLGEFQGVQFAMTNATERDGTTLVGTRITRPNQQPNTVQWVVAPINGQPKIVDVIAEGTSLRLTQRSDYTSYITQHGNEVAPLIAAMQRQVGG